MKKILVPILVLFLITATSALAVDLELTCNPTSVNVPNTVACDLSFSGGQSLLAIAGTLTIPSQLENSVAFTNMPGTFTGSYASGTGKFSIDDISSVAGAAGVTKIATLTFTSALAGENVKIGVAVDAASTIDQSFAPITLTSTSIESNGVTIVGACQSLTECPADKNCGSISDGCTGTLSCGTCTGDKECFENKCREPDCTPVAATACTIGISCSGGGVIDNLGCPPGQQCNAQDECEVIPQESLCTDGTKNGDETGVDCGGSCPACPVLEGTIGDQIDAALKEEGITKGTESTKQDVQESWTITLISKLASIFKSFFGG